ncbi:hypothetical protein [Neoroseomonas rubea]|uniref:hypothetical protein n=1 Tax=Neoroseomonas rubea TaxID=2748666 RepID=UPI0018DFB310|nr:hypothetical protein [Roseomonas rubea]
MTISEEASKAIAAFETKHPKSKGKAYLTSGERSVDEQIEIIFDPKRKDNYLNIKQRFLSKYKIKKLPAREALSAEQLSWWRKEVSAQAGKPGGFAHIGGFAQDISVRLLNTQEKIDLEQTLQDHGIHVLREKVTGTSSEYAVSVEKANVFHVTASKKKK